jgi:hypothetical protein
LIAKMVALKLSAVALAIAQLVIAGPTPPPPVFSTTCGGKAYTYNELAGYGFVPADSRDKFGDTISVGSSIAVSKWTKNGKSYKGTLWGLPDRGWNTNGTQNTIPRVHKFEITFTPAPDATLESPSPPNLQFVYKDTILLIGPDCKPASGLDPDQSGGLTYPGFPLLPAATYTGDGFGGPGSGGKRISIDAEGLVLDDDGNFWISDEYGPYVYKFSKKGKMLTAIAPPDAILPLRNGEVSFSSDNPPIYAPAKHPKPTNPTQGRQNNQGFEGLTVSPNGKNLYVLLQSAGRQEGGKDSTTRRHARLLKYSIKPEQKKPTPTYEAEWVVPLPTFTNAAGALRVAAQSEIHFISDTQFFILPRDSSVGQGFADPTSVYRHVDIFDISSATNIKGPAYDAFNASIASDGKFYSIIAIWEKAKSCYSWCFEAGNHGRDAVPIHQLQHQRPAPPLRRPQRSDR